MSSRHAEELFAARRPNAKGAESEAKDRFRARCKRAVSDCLLNAFLLEECSGPIWEETLVDHLSLSEVEQRERYQELLEWVKNPQKTLSRSGRRNLRSRNST